jgi:hypothetical protein
MFETPTLCRTLLCRAAEIHDLDSKADFILEKRNPCPNPRPNRLRNQTLNSPNIGTFARLGNFLLF